MTFRRDTKTTPIKYAHSTFGLQLASSADYMPVKHGESVFPRYVGTKYNIVEAASHHAACWQADDFH